MWWHWREKKKKSCHIKFGGHLSNTIIIVVCFLLGDSPASEFYKPTFRNTLFHLHRQVGAYRMN